MCLQRHFGLVRKLESGAENSLHISEEREVIFKVFLGDGRAGNKASVSWRDSTMDIASPTWGSFPC